MDKFPATLLNGQLLRKTLKHTHTHIAIASKKVLLLHYALKCSAASSSCFSGHQGSSQSDPCTVTGFGSFKLSIHDWLQKGRSHFHTESSPVWWLHAMYCRLTYTCDYMWDTCGLTTCGVTHWYIVLALYIYELAAIKIHTQFNLPKFTLKQYPILN